MMIRSFCCILVATSLMARSPCVLGGRVIDGSSAKPLDRAQVFIRDIDGGAAYRAVTNAAGSFCFRELDPGSYEILIKHHGYADLQAVNAGGVKSATLVIEPRARSLEFTISMSPSTVIAGIVMLKSGDPLADAEVTLYGHFPPGGLVTPVDPRRTTTDATGRFRFAGIEAGVYHLGVGAQRETLAQDLTAGAGGEQQLDTFYPASLTTDDARGIKLASGQEITGLVITMQTAPFRTLAGRIVAKDVPTYVMAIYHEPSGAETDYAIEVKPDGTFSRGGLPAATYTVHIGPKFDQRIDLTTGNVTNLVIELDNRQP